MFRILHNKEVEQTAAVLYIARSLMSNFICHALVRVIICRVSSVGFAGSALHSKGLIIPLGGRQVILTIWAAADL